MPFMVIYTHVGRQRRATSRPTPSTRPPSSSSASATRRASRRSASTGWRRSASPSVRTTRWSSGCPSGRRADAADRSVGQVRAAPRCRRRASGASTPPDAPSRGATRMPRRRPSAPSRPPPAADDGDGRRQRPSGPLRSLTRVAGHPSAWSSSAASASAHSPSDRGRRHAQRGEQQREQRTPERSRTHHGSSVLLDDLAHLHACRLPPRLESRPSGDHAVRRCYRRPPTASCAAPAPAGGRAGAGADAGSSLVVVVVLLGFAVLGASLVPVPYVTLRPGSTRPVTEQVLVEGAPSYPPDESIAYTTVSVGHDDAARGAGRVARRRRRRAAGGGGARWPHRKRRTAGTTRS